VTRPPGRPTWSNWAGNQRATPAELVSPAGRDALAAAVVGAVGNGLRVKVVGSGHSFTDAAVTDGVLVRLDRHQRVLEVDRDRLQVTVEAGITLRRLNATLAAYGMALPNLGDIDYQTLAGALATGTHGTGTALPCLAANAIGIELITADGRVRWLSASAGDDPEAFAAARVSVGALGVVSAVRLQCVPAFNLRALEVTMPLDEVRERFDELAATNEHFEFFWTPGSRWAQTKRNNRVDGPPAPRSPVRAAYDELIYQNAAFWALGRLGRRRPGWARALRRRLPVPGPADYVDRSDRVFTSPRLVRFYEMEYGFDRRHALDVLAEVRSVVAGTGLRIGFPIEVRVSAADDIWLSMGTGRPSCFMAFHVFKGQPYDAYFRAVERIIDQVGGRPHWGKLHFQTAATLAGRYPDWDRFASVRRRLDPDGVFANRYTDRVLGPVRAAGGG